MTRVGRSVILMALAAVGISVALAQPSAACASGVEVWMDDDSVPATTSVNTPFLVDVSQDGVSGASYVVAVKAVTSETVYYALTPKQEDETDEGDEDSGVSSLQFDGGSFVSEVRLPSPGDWTLQVRAFSSEATSSPIIARSESALVSCNPAVVRFASSLSRTSVNYSSPAVFKTTITHPDGSPVASATVQLIVDSDEWDGPVVAGTYQTDASGTVSANVTNGRRWEGAETYWIFSRMRWAWRLSGTESAGGCISPSMGTKASVTQLGWALDSVRKAGKVRLTAGRRYQFWYRDGVGNPRSTFTLKNSAGQKVLSVWVTRVGQNKVFTVRKTGYYYWTMTKPVWSSSWLIW